MVSMVWNLVSEYNWDIIAKKTMDVYKDTIRLAKAHAVKVKFEETSKIQEKLSAIAPTEAQEDNTITTSTTDSEIRGILPNPLRKLRKATEN